MRTNANNDLIPANRNAQLLLETVRTIDWFSMIPMGDIAKRTEAGCPCAQILTKHRKLAGKTSSWTCHRQLGSYRPIPFLQSQNALENQLQVDVAHLRRIPKNPNPRRPCRVGQLSVECSQHRRPPHRQLQVGSIIGGQLERAAEVYCLQLALCRRDRVLSNLPKRHPQ